MEQSLLRLRNDLSNLLSMEESDTTDWNEVEQICTNLIEMLNETKTINLIDDFVYHFLEDFEIRQRDEGYGIQQRRKLKLRLQ